MAQIAACLPMLRSLVGSRPLHNIMQSLQNFIALSSGRHENIGDSSSTIELGSADAMKVHDANDSSFKASAIGAKRTYSGDLTDHQGIRVTHELDQFRQDA